MIKYLYSYTINCKSINVAIIYYVQFIHLTCASQLTIIILIPITHMLLLGTDWFPAVLAMIYVHTYSKVILIKCQINNKN